MIIWQTLVTHKSCKKDLRGNFKPFYTHSVFYRFVGLTLKGLNVNLACLKLLPVKCECSEFVPCLFKIKRSKNAKMNSSGLISISEDFWYIYLNVTKIHTIGFKVIGTVFPEEKGNLKELSAMF